MEKINNYIVFFDISNYKLQGQTTDIKRELVIFKYPMPDLLNESLTLFGAINHYLENDGVKDFESAKYLNCYTENVADNNTMVYELDGSLAEYDNEGNLLHPERGNLIPEFDRFIFIAQTQPIILSQLLSGFVSMLDNRGAFDNYIRFPNNNKQIVGRV